MLLNKELTEKLLEATSVEQVREVVEGNDLQAVSRIAINTALKKVFNRTCYGVKDTAIEMLVKLSRGEETEDVPVVPDVRSIKADRRAKIKNAENAEVLLSKEERNSIIDESLIEFLNSQTKEIVLLRTIKSKAPRMKEINLNEEDLKEFAKRHSSKYTCALNSSGKLYIYRGVDFEAFKTIHDKWGDVFYGYPELGDEK